MKLYHTKYSRYLISLSVIVLVLSFGMFLITYLIVSHIESDGAAINEAGAIRGSIQRITKLSINDNYSSFEKISSRIDMRINRYLNKPSGYFGLNLPKEIINERTKLRKLWVELQSKLLLYKENKSPPGLIEIINLSEKCWNTANNIVLIFQRENEKDIEYIKTLYVFLFANIFCIIASLVIIIFYVRKTLEYSSSHDLMTNAYNRKAYEDLIKYEINRCQRYGRSLSLIFIDIDFFKKINDNYGHDVGDKVIIEAVAIIRQLLRKTDQLFRMGGDEFGIIAPETKIKGAVVLAEKIRKCIKKYSFSSNCKVTVSLGVAGYSKGDTPQQIYKKADIALYSAKNKGKNISKIYEE